jgi:L-lactate dehydrogenase complex protein LldG
MNESKTRDKILKRIRLALLDKSPDPYPDVNFTAKPDEYDEQEFPELLFAQNFMAAGGYFTFCENKTELAAFLQQAVDQLTPQNIICTHPSLINLIAGLTTPAVPTDASRLSISSCFCLTAYPPSVIVSSSSGFHAAAHHILIASAHNTVFDLKSGIQKIKEAVRDGKENHFEIISFAENGNDENRLLLPARNFFIAMTDLDL